MHRDVSPVVMTAFDLDTNNVYYFNVDSTEFLRDIKLKKHNSN